MDTANFARLKSEGAFDKSNPLDIKWETPIPFSAVKTPDFPVSCLPKPVSAFVNQLSESTQTPQEMSGILSLGILATAFQAGYKVEITPDWREPLCLYTVAVAEPGERKSAVISALCSPAYEYEAERKKIEAAEVAKNQTERALLEKTLQIVQNEVSKGKNGVDISAKRQEAFDLSVKLDNFEDRHPFKLIVDDTTPEKLIDLMEKQKGCITVASAEGGVLDSLKGRYDQVANFDIYLKGHAGDTISVDRIGRKSNRIADPRLTVMLTIQPSVLHGLMDNPTLRGRGLCGRFLYAMCKSKMGRREVSPAPISNEVKEAYRQFVRKILANQGSGIVYLSTEANAVREEFQANIEKKLTPGGEWSYMRDWGGKLTGAMARIAALLHLSGFSVIEPISKETMLAAVRIADFLGVHAEAAYQAMGVDESVDHAQYILEKLIDGGKERISRADLTRLCRGKFKKAKDMNPAIDVLVDRFYIQIVEKEIDYNNRKEMEYLINPSVWK